MNIIFLDVDGVLNCTYTTINYNGITGIEPEKIAFLKEIVNFTNGKIVLISSWAQDKDLYNYLSFQLSLENLFIFDCICNNPINRSDCILNWIKLYKPSFYIILDDCFSYYKNSHLKHNLIKISPNTGLSKKHLNAIKKLLLGEKI